MIDYLSEIEPELKTILACVSGVQMGRIPKISWHTPFTFPTLGKVHKLAYCCNNIHILKSCPIRLYCMMLGSIGPPPPLSPQPSRNCVCHTMDKYIIQHVYNLQIFSPPPSPLKIPTRVRVRDAKTTQQKRREIKNFVSLNMRRMALKSEHWVNNFG